MKLMKKVIEFFFNIKLAFIIFIIFIIGYIILLDVEGAFTKRFLNFGPSKDTKFINMTLDTWPKVISVYILSFLASLLTQYYKSISYNFIHSFIWNPAYTKKIHMTKTWATFIVSLEPILYWILQIIEFFINLIIELQFLIPKFIGQALIDIPYGLYMVNQNKYKKI